MRSLCMYASFSLLLRSLRACSLGVVLAEVAKNLYMYVEADGKAPCPVLSTLFPRIDKEGAVC